MHFVHASDHTHFDGYETNMMINDLSNSFYNLLIIYCKEM